MKTVWQTARTARRSRIISVLMLVAFLTPGCKQGDHDEQISPERFGLLRTAAEAKLVEQAIAIANTVLTAKGSPLTFVFGTAEVFRQHQIPVLLLSPKNLSKSDVIWVPTGCQCVFIQAPAIRTWLNGVREADGYGDPFEEKYALAFMLLHEMGHVISGESGAYADGEDTMVNIERTDAKQAEIAADEFAKSALRNALRSKGSSEKEGQAMLQAIKVMSYNVYLAATLSQSLEEILCLNPKLYWDMGYSHPNLVFRLMEIVHELAPSAEFEKVVSTYAECRGEQPSYFNKIN